MQSLRDEHGTSPVHHVRQEMKLNGKSNKYLNAKFWNNLQEIFELRGSAVYEHLPEPSGADLVDPELMRAVQTIHPNPSIRQTNDYCSYFEYNENFNETKAYGALMACRSQLNLSAEHQKEMELILIGTTMHVTRPSNPFGLLLVIIGKQSSPPTSHPRATRVGPHLFVITSNVFILVMES